MEVVSVDVASLVFDPSNARKHSPKNIEAIKGSLAKFGQQKPIVIDANNIVVAGNGTLEAARALGWDKISVVKTELTGTEAIAFAIADNRTAELAEWDKDILGKTLQSLREDNFELMEIGFDTSYLDDLYSEPKTIEGAKELGEEDFQKFDKCCPRCGFEFDAKDPT